MLEKWQKSNVGFFADAFEHERVEVLQSNVIKLFGVVNKLVRLVIAPFPL